MSIELELEEVLEALEEVTDTWRLANYLGIRPPRGAGSGGIPGSGGIAGSRVGVGSGGIAGIGGIPGSGAIATIGVGVLGKVAPPMTGIRVHEDLHKNKEQLIDYWLQKSPV